MAKYNDLTVGQMEAAINMMGGWDNFLRFLRGDLVVRAKEIVTNILKLTVRYGRSIADGIAAGKYDWVNENITQKNFPDSQSGVAEVEIHLLHFGKLMSTAQVLAEIEKQNFRPATLQELLAVGEQHSELQREFPIVALGSVWQIPSGPRDVVPCLFEGGRERLLDLNWAERGWDDSSRFASVRK